MIAICLTAASPWLGKATFGCFHVFTWYRTKSDRHLLGRMLLKTKKKRGTDYRLPGSEKKTKYFNEKSKVTILTYVHMISYICTWGLLLLVFHWNTYFIFLVGTSVPNLVVGSRQDIFFSVSITYGNTHAGRILFDTKRKRENSRVWSFEVRVMLLLDRSRALMILTGAQLWVACGHTTTVVYHG